MPVLSPTSHVAMGIDGQLSVDGLVLVAANVYGRAWLNAGEVATSNGASLLAVGAASGSQRPLDPYPVNDLVAGAGVWATWSNADAHDTGREWGYRDAHGHTDWATVDGVRTKVRDWHPLAVDDRTGTIALLTAGGRGEDLAFWDGVTLRPLHAGPLYPAPTSFHDGEFAATLPNGTVIVWAAPSGAARGLPTTRVIGALVSRGFRAGLFDNYLLCVSRESETTGLKLSADGFDFNPDIRAQDDGTVLVATSTTAGERVDHLRRYVIDFAHDTVNGTLAERFDLTKPIVDPTPPEPKPPEPKPPEPKPPEPIHPIPPTPLPAPFPLEMFMSDDPIVPFPKTALIKNAAGDVRDAVFLGAQHYHIKHPKGGFLSFDSAANAFRPAGASKVGSEENFQYFDGETVCVMNFGWPGPQEPTSDPLSLRAFVVAIHL